MRRRTWTGGATAVRAAAVLLLSFGLGLPSLVRAEEPPDYSRERGYVSLSGVYGADELTDALSVGSKDSGGIGLRVGYRMVKWLAFELGGEWQYGFGSVDNPFTITANLKGYYPYWGRFQPFIVVGGGMMAAYPDFTGGSLVGGAFRAGAGADVFITDRLAVTTSAEWVSGTGEVDEVNWVSVGLGLMYHF